MADTLGQFIPFSEALRKHQIKAGEGKYKSLEPGYTPGFLDSLLHPEKVNLYKDLAADQEFFEDIYRKNKGIFDPSIQPPKTFGEASQQIPLGMQSLGIQPPQVPLIPQGGMRSNAGETIFNEKEYSDLLNAALMKNMPTIPSGRPGEVIPTPPVARGEMVPDFSAPVSPVQQAQLMQFAGALPQQAAEQVVKPPVIRPPIEIGGVPYTQLPSGAIAPTPGFVTPQAKANPKLEEVTAFMGQLGIDPKSAEGKKYLKNYLEKATTSHAAPSANVTIKQEGAEAAAVGKALGEQYVDIQKAGVDASSKISKLDRMSSLMEGVTTGKLTPAITDVQALGQSLGFQVDPSLPAKQAIESLSNEIALELRNTGSGAGMPGQLSDKDREFLVSMTPNLSKTPEGNKLIIDTRKKLLQRQQEIAKLTRDYRKKHGKIDEGLYEDMQQYADKHPLFKARPSAQARFSQLEKSGMKKDAIYRQLATEGY